MTGADGADGKDTHNSLVGSGRKAKRAQGEPAGPSGGTVSAARDRSPDLDSEGLHLARRAVHDETVAKKKRLSGGVKLKSVVFKSGICDCAHRNGHGVGQRHLCAGRGDQCTSFVGSGDGNERSAGFMAAQTDSGAGNKNVAGNDSSDRGGTSGNDQGDEGGKDGDENSKDITDGGDDEWEDESGSDDDGDERGADSTDSTVGDSSGDGGDGKNDVDAGPSGGGGGRRGNKVNRQMHRGAVGGKKKDLPRISYSTGNGVLRAAVVHAVRALGGFKMATLTRRAVDDGEAEVERVPGEAPTVFVVARRPRRSVRLLLSLARGSWVVSEAWLVDSIRARAWQPFGMYIPKAFPGVLAARAACAQGESLFKGLRFGSRGTINMDVADLRELVECAGGRLGSNRDADVVIVGDESGGRVPALTVETAVMVNQLWLPDCVAQWKKLPFDSYVVL